MCSLFLCVVMAIIMLERKSIHISGRGSAQKFAPDRPLHFAVHHHASVGEGFPLPLGSPLSQGSPHP